MTPIKIVLFTCAVIGLAGLIDCKKLQENPSAPADMRDKRGLENGFGYGDWTAPSTWNPAVWPSTKHFSPSPNDIAHIISAAKQASADVYIAQQRVAAAKEEVLEQQRLAKEKEAHALIATQKAESAQQMLRSEAQNVVFAQQKLAKAKSEASEISRIASLKESEAAAALTQSAQQAYAEIQKAEQAAKLAALKRAHHNSHIGSPVSLKSAFPIGPAKLIPLTFSSDPWKPVGAWNSPFINKAPWY